jgi:hypothetical protein
MQQFSQERNKIMSEYLSRFLSMRCSGDVLNAVSPFNNPSKEITESMAAIKHIKQFALKKKMHYNLFDLCAGNALTSITAIHMLPIKEAVAIDKKKRSGNYGIVKRFTYLQEDIGNFDYGTNDSIVVAIHPCNTATQIIELFNSTPSMKHLILMPCCNDEIKEDNGLTWLFNHKKISKYDIWTLFLYSQIAVKDKHVATDENVLSPKNNIIVASKFD